MLDRHHPSAKKYVKLGLDYHWKALKRKDKSTYRDSIHAIMGVLPSDPGAALLDFGCGTGVLASYCADRGFVVTGYDPYGPAIEEARRRVPAATFTDESPSGVWPYVISHNVGEHMENVRPLVEILRTATTLAIVQVAKPGHDEAAVSSWTPDAYRDFLAAIGEGRQMSELADRSNVTAWIIRP